MNRVREGPSRCDADTLMTMSPQCLDKHGCTVRLRTADRPWMPLFNLEKWWSEGGVELLRVDQELLPIGHADLFENVRQMVPHRTVGNRQPEGDLFVGETLTEQSDHLVFALGHDVRPRRQLCFQSTFLLGPLFPISSTLRLMAFGLAAVLPGRIQGLDCANTTSGG